eukprot:GHVN01077194.1.p1 GENE.GHVN01077194.1~~GHVN01077194.1.p1  ORF type:complete len:332 (+),score=37.49 GHVN01077194.1:79-1074(+)
MWELRRRIPAWGRRLTQPTSVSARHFATAPYQFVADYPPDESPKVNPLVGALPSDLKRPSQHPNHQIALVAGEIDSFQEAYVQSTVIQNLSEYRLTAVGNHSKSQLTKWVDSALEKVKGPKPLIDSNIFHADKIRFKEHRQGLTAAHHYPNVTLPRGLAHQVPTGIYVRPLSAAASSATGTSQPAIIQPPVGSSGVDLRTRLVGHCTVVWIWSGRQPHSGPEAVRKWIKAVSDHEANSTGRGVADTLQRFKKKGLKEVFFHVVESSSLQATIISLLKTFEMTVMATTSDFVKRGSLLLYNGPLSHSVSKEMHLYNQHLPTVLVVDHHGYIR